MGINLSENPPPEDSSDHVRATTSSHVVQAYSEIGIWSWKELLVNRDHDWGSKAVYLASLANAGLPVPAGVLINRLPNIEDWQILLGWWEHMGHPPLAVRGSQDNKEGTSVESAGQQSSFLNQVDEFALLGSIHAYLKEPSFRHPEGRPSDLHPPSPAAAKNVLIQVMVDAQFAGHYFSIDPIHKKEDWTLQVSSGPQGTNLADTDYPIGIHMQDPCPLPNWDETWTDDLILIGRKAEQILGFDLDLEWIIDRRGKIWILQVRPMTQRAAKVNIDPEPIPQEEPTPLVAQSPNTEPPALTEINDVPMCPDIATPSSPEITAAESALTNQDQDQSVPTFLVAELEKLVRRNSPSMIWDGQTFNDFSGIVSPLTLSIWQEAFGIQGAVGRALQTLGYPTETNHDVVGKISALEDILGHAYLNIGDFATLFLTDHSADKKTLTQNLMRNLKFISDSLRLDWRRFTKRKKWLYEAEQALLPYHYTKPLNVNPGLFDKSSTADLAMQFLAEVQAWSQEASYWQWTLTLSTETSLRALQSLFWRIYGPANSWEQIKKWLDAGLEKAGRESREAVNDALRGPHARAEFIALYGQCGPRDYDLAQPRWEEIAGDTFEDLATQILRAEISKNDIDAEIAHAPKIYRPTLRHEWLLLRQTLDLRARWKMALMQPYSHLRYLAKELGRRWQIGDDIFFLQLNDLPVGDHLPPATLAKLRENKTQHAAFTRLSLPQLLGWQDLNELLASFKNAVANPTPGNEKESTDPEDPPSHRVAQEITVHNTKDDNTTDSPTAWPSGVVWPSRLAGPLPAVLTPFTWLAVAQHAATPSFATSLGLHAPGAELRSFLHLVKKTKNLILFAALCAFLYSGANAYHFLRHLPMPSWYVAWQNKNNPTADERVYLDSQVLFNLAERSTPTRPQPKGINLIWEKRSPGGAFSDVTLSGESLFLGSEDGYVYELDRASGSVIRRFYIGTAVHLPPVVWNQRLIVSDGGQETHHARIYAFDLKSGKLLNSFSTRSQIGDAPTLVTQQHQTLLLLAAGHDGLYALDPMRLQPIWQRKLGWVNSALLAVHDRVFLATVQHPSDPRERPSAVALDLTTGQVIWRRQLASSSWSAPIYMADRVCYGLGERTPENHYGQVACFDLATGTPISAINFTEAPLTTLLHGKQNLIVNDVAGRICSVDLMNGQRRWCQSFDGPMERTKTYINLDKRGLILYSSPSSAVVALNPVTGDRVSEWLSPDKKGWGQVNSTIKSDGHSLFVVDAEGVLRKLQYAD